MVCEGSQVGSVHGKLPYWPNLLGYLISSFQQQFVPGSLKKAKDRATGLSLIKESMELYHHLGKTPNLCCCKNWVLHRSWPVHPLPLSTDYVAELTLQPRCGQSISYPLGKPKKHHLVYLQCFPAPTQTAHSDACVEKSRGL